VHGRRESVSQSVSQVEDGNEAGTRDRAKTQVGAAIFTPFTPRDAATVRARSIRHSNKQSVRYVRSSQDASDGGRSRWSRRAASTTIGAARRVTLRQPVG